MSKVIYDVVNGSAKKVKKQYAVIDSKTHAIMTSYDVVNGKTHLCYENAISISGAVVTLVSSELECTKSYQMPEVASVVLNGKTLTKDVDYTISEEEKP